MRKFVAVFALVFFFAPTLAWVAGVRARPFENRAMASRPALSQGWDAFDGATDFFVDRLPLREQAVRANTWASVHVFDTAPDYSRNAAAGDEKPRDALPFAGPATPTPTPATSELPPPEQAETSVFKGRGDWLFLEADFTYACRPFQAWDVVMERYDRLLKIIRDSGRKVMFVIPPDKSTVYADYVPKDGFVEQDCYQAGKQRTWSELEGGGRPELLPLRATMLAGKAPEPEETYWPQDTHWNTKGGVQAARAVLAHLGGPPIADADVVRERAKHKGDLAALIGGTSELVSPEWTIRRPALARPRVTREKSGPVNQIVTSRYPGGGPLQVPGRTAFLSDSFGAALGAALAPYMHEFVSVLWLGTPRKDLIGTIESADTVIIEKVERDVTALVSDGGIAGPPFLDALEARLTQR